MSDWLRIAGRALVNGPLELLVRRENRARLGRYITDRALGENVNDSALNGEDRVADAVKRAIGANPATVFDVGLNVGDWTRHFAAGMGPNLAIYAFEPCVGTFQRTREKLRDLTETAGGPRVELFDVGLSDRDGTAEMFTGVECAGTNSLYRRDGNFHTGTAQVKIARGDGFCRERGIEEIEFLKIDAEGHELPILRGFESFISERRIGCIQFEYNNTWIDSRHFLHDAFSLLVPAGYALARIHQGGLEFFAEYKQALERFQLSNYLAVRADRIGLFPVLP